MWFRLAAGQGEADGHVKHEGTSGFTGADSSDQNCKLYYDNVINETACMYRLSVNWFLAGSQSTV